jgi:hypothetical protein
MLQIVPRYPPLDHLTVRRLTHMGYDEFAASEFPFINT